MCVCVCVCVCVYLLSTYDCIQIKQSGYLSVTRCILLLTARLCLSVFHCSGNTETGAHLNVRTQGFGEFTINKLIYIL